MLWRGPVPEALPWLHFDRTFGALGIYLSDSIHSLDSLDSHLLVL